MPPSLARRYFRTLPPPPLAEIRQKLWTDVAAAEIGPVLEQYKMYAEMADRISARRGLTNTFFLTLNTSIPALVIGTWQGKASPPAGLVLFMLALMLIQCLAWFWLVRSYRQLNAAKYAVIGALEEQLPASPYWSAEWAALGQGKDPARYFPLTHLEQVIPALFAITYTVGALAVILH